MQKLLEISTKTANYDPECQTLGSILSLRLFSDLCWISLEISNDYNLNQQTLCLDPYLVAKLDMGAKHCCYATTWLLTISSLQKFPELGFHLQTFGNLPAHSLVLLTGQLLSLHKLAALLSHGVRLPAENSTQRKCNTVCCLLSELCFPWVLKHETSENEKQK